jgi:hypothetical protein
MFITALFTLGKLWKQLKCASINEWIKKCGFYIQWNFSQPQRRMKICALQDGTGEHHLK